MILTASMSLLSKVIDDADNANKYVLTNYEEKNKESGCYT